MGCKLAAFGEIIALGGHRRIFPKSYAKTCCINLLPFNSIWQLVCATGKASFRSGAKTATH
jgi:hypothetical protein